MYCLVSTVFNAIPIIKKSGKVIGLKDKILEK